MTYRSPLIYLQPLLVSTFIFASGANGTAALMYSATADPNAAPDANAAVDVWTVNLTSGDPGQNGSFLGDSGQNAGGSSGAGAGNPAWAIYANSGQTAEAFASVSSLAGRPLNQPGEFLSLDFDNGYIDNGGMVGVQFWDENAVVQHTFYFFGGDANYAIDDLIGTTNTGIGWTGDGFTLTLTLDATPGEFTLDVGGIASFPGLVGVAGTPSIDTIRVFNHFAGSGSNADVYFNNLLISIPEPSSAMFMGVIASILSARRWWIRRRRTSA